MASGRQRSQFCRAMQECAPPDLRDFRDSGATPQCGMVTGWRSTVRANFVAVAGFANR
jgi:hypothetical protein